MYYTTVHHTMLYWHHATCIVHYITSHQTPPLFGKGIIKYQKINRLTKIIVKPGPTKAQIAPESTDNQQLQQIITQDIKSLNLKQQEKIIKQRNTYEYFETTSSLKIAQVIKAIIAGQPEI